MKLLENKLGINFPDSQSDCSSFLIGYFTSTPFVTVTLG